MSTARFCNYCDAGRFKCRCDAGPRRPRSSCESSCDELTARTMRRTSKTSVVSLLLLASARTADAYVVGSRSASQRAPPIQLSATETPVPPPDVAPPPAASTTTPSSIPVPPPDLPASLETCSQPLKPGQAIRGLYRAFNSRDAEAAASYLTEDCVYEDLLLGPYTVCRGRQAFCDALKFHPAFVSAQFFSELPFASLLPDLTLEVDSVAEGVDTVGVEWHVQLGDQPFPLGRGLSQASVDPATGKIVSSAPRPARLRARPNCARARDRDRPRPPPARRAASSTLRRRRGASSARCSCPRSPSPRWRPAGSRRTWTASAAPGPRRRRRPSSRRRSCCARARTPRTPTGGSASRWEALADRSGCRFCVRRILSPT